VLAIAGASLALVAVQSENNTASAADSFKIIVPNVAADSALARPRPQPTPTVAFDSDRWVNIQMNITAKEAAVSASGQVDVPISVAANAKIPTVLEGPITVTGHAFVQPHVTDSAGCVWSRTFTNPDFKMTVFYSADLSVIASVDGPEWYYIVQCPGSSGQLPPVRFPLSGSIPLYGYLQTTMGAYRVGNGVRLPMDVISEFPISCLKRTRTFDESAFNAHAVIQVYVYQPDFPGGCLVPLLP
jgi:hypothetical protein